MNTLYGLIEVDWRRFRGGLDLRLTLPTNTRAQVRVPTPGLDDCQITESGLKVWNEGTYIPGIAGITAGERDGDNDVDLADYNALAGNFSPAGYGAAAVPEPASVCLLLAALLVLARGRF